MSLMRHPEGPEALGRRVGRRVLNKWWLPESGNAPRCLDVMSRRVA